MNGMKKGLSLFLTVTVTLWALTICGFGTASAASEGDFTYTVSGNSATVTQYTGSGGAVTIPNKLGGYAVTSIGQYAFSGCTGLTSVTIPDSVTSIGQYAFYYCTGLTSVTIPDSVTSIGPSVLTGTSYYNNVDNWESGVLYCGHHLIQANKDQVPNSYIMKDGTKTIAVYAFSGCTGLTEITIPNRVTSIGGGAFSGCKGLTSVTIPNSVTSIGGAAFCNCFKLTSVTIPGTVSGINQEVFQGCTALTNLTITKDVTTANFGSAFPYCTTVTFLDGVTSIRDYAFSGCTGLTEITIPNSVTSIGNHAFLGCTGLTEITIPSSVTSIGAGAFRNCTGLTSVTIPDSVTSIGDYAFDGCTGLTNVNIGDSVTSIGSSVLTGTSYYNNVDNWESGVLYCGHHLIQANKDQVPNKYIMKDGTKTIAGSAFYGCTGLTEITIPNSVTSIGNHAFLGCTGLTEITIPGSVTSMGYSAFYGCTGLTSVTIPNSVTSIGSSAFSGCTGLIEITISDSVTSIGDLALRGCTGLTTITYEGTKEQWVQVTGYEQIPRGLVRCSNSSEDEKRFACSITDNQTIIIRYRGNDSAVTVPATLYGSPVIAIGENAFAGCSDLEAVVLSDGITSIGENAFADCENLTAITIPTSVTFVDYTSFPGCDSLSDVYYGGSCRQWRNRNSLNGSYLRIHCADQTGHIGGTATCAEQAVCAVCGEHYGETTAHHMTFHSAKEPDADQAGIIAYWSCDRCDQIFADEAGEQAIALSDTVLPARTYLKVEALIAALPDVVTLADASAVQAARAAYDALTEEQKALVTPEAIQRLEQAEAALAEWEDARQAAQEVKDQIAALPAADELTLADREAVEAARAAFDALDEKAQSLVTNETRLLQAEVRLTRLEVEELRAVVQAMTEQLNALPTPDEVTEVSRVEIEAARTAYDALTEEQKALVTPEAVQRLEQAEAALAELTAVTFGDVNGDGAVNAADALLALQHSVKLTELTGNAAVAADVSGDDTVNAGDALLILQYSVKLIDRFPAEGA